MPPPAAVDKNGKPIKMSFLNAFMGTGPQIERSRKGMNLVVPKNKKPEITRDTSTAPTISTPATEAAKAMEPALATEAAPTAEPAPATETPTIPKPAEAIETASINSDAMAWTAAQDGTLIGMKALNRSWKEISEAIPGKNIGDLKQRFKDLQVQVKGKGKVEVGEMDGGEGSSKKKDKGKAGKKQVQFAAPEDSDSDCSYIDPEVDIPLTRPTDMQLPQQGVLKIVEVDSDEEEPIDIRGRPIVYVQPEDDLDEEELQLLFALTKKNDRAKWLEVASRFFDKTGKRLEPELLKQMLNNL